MIKLQRKPAFICNMVTGTNNQGNAQVIASLSACFVWWLYGAERRRHVHRLIRGQSRKKFFLQFLWWERGGFEINGTKQHLCGKILQTALVLNIPKRRKCGFRSVERDDKLNKNMMCPSPPTDFCRNSLASVVIMLPWLWIGKIAWKKIVLMRICHYCALTRHSYSRLRAAWGRVSGMLCRGGQAGGVHRMRSIFMQSTKEVIVES